MSFQVNGKQTQQVKDTKDIPLQEFPILQGILCPFTLVILRESDSMKTFIDEYRRFRHLVREDIGDLEDADIMLLFSIYIERRPTPNPFAGLESFFKGYESIFQPRPNDDPDDEDFNDDPFHNTTQ